MEVQKTLHILCKKSLLLQAFIKKETLTQVFSYKFCEISKNIFFTEDLWTTVSANADICTLSIGYLQKKLIYTA